MRYTWKCANENARSNTIGEDGSAKPPSELRRCVSVNHAGVKLAWRFRARAVSTETLFLVRLLRLLVLLFRWGFVFVFIFHLKTRKFGQGRFLLIGQLFGHFDSRLFLQLIDLGSQLGDLCLILDIY